jgi:hypothetical protein
MIRSTRLLVLNNYSLTDTWQEVRRGDTPDHHLYGINHLQDMGYAVKVIEADSSRALSALATALRRLRNPVPLGAIDRQCAAWRALREGDLIYAPCGDQLTSLAYLRALGVLGTPLISVQHHALNRGRLAGLREPFVRLMVRGTDACPALSQRAADQINAHCHPHAPRSTVLRWGPAADFYPRSDEPGTGALAAGRTGRDFSTFGQAATRVGTPAQIICQVLPTDASEFGSNVRLRLADAGQAFTYPEMMREHLEARVIAIPLAHSENSLAGLTSLVDAIALGKPMVMTRNPYIDIDIEGLGIGRWVDAGDVEGWADALAWFNNHPEESLEMGRRGRRLVDDEGFNSLGFARQIRDLIESVSTAQRVH